jgi:polyisoprenoid-binding protein YceI
MAEDAPINSIAASVLKQWLDTGATFILIDVLPEEVYVRRHIPGAMNACVYEVVFPSRIAELGVDLGQPLVVYGSGEQSQDAAVAAEKLVRLGCRSVHVLTGGASAWERSGFAFEGEHPDLPIDPGTRLRLSNGSWQVDGEQSLIEWTGRSGNGRHIGTVGLKQGHLTLEQGRLSGNFAIDMRSIRNMDLEGNELQPVLIAHLESDDFFFVKLFPTAHFTIASGRPLEPPYLSSVNFSITGNLELRGISRQISFPATLSPLPEGGIAAEAHFDLDRTFWNVIYGSTRFFEHLGMHVVFDTISIQLRLVAR